MSKIKDFLEESIKPGFSGKLTELAKIIDEEFNYGEMELVDRISFLENLKDAANEMVYNIYFERNKIINAETQEPMTLRECHQAADILAKGRPDYAILDYITDVQRKNKKNSTDDKQSYGELLQELRSDSGALGVNLEAAYKAGQEAAIMSRKAKKPDIVTKASTFKLSRKQVFKNINFYKDNLYMQQLGIHDIVANYNMSMSVSGKKEKASNLINSNRDIIFGDRKFCISRDRNKAEYEKSIIEQYNKLQISTEEVEVSEELLAVVTAERQKAAEAKTFVNTKLSIFIKYHDDISFIYDNIVKERLESAVSSSDKEDKINNLKELLENFFKYDKLPSGTKESIDSELSNIGNVKLTYESYSETHFKRKNIKEFFLSFIELKEPQFVYDELDSSFKLNGFAQAQAVLFQEKLFGLLNSETIIKTLDTQKSILEAQKNLYSFDDKGIDHDKYLKLSKDYKVIFDLAKAIEDNKIDGLPDEVFSNSKIRITKEKLLDKTERELLEYLKQKNKQLKDLRKTIEEGLRKDFDDSFYIKRGNDRIVKKRNFFDLNYFTIDDLKITRSKLQNLLEVIQKNQENTNSENVIDLVDNWLITASYFSNGSYVALDRSFLSSERQKTIDAITNKINQIDQVLLSNNKLSNIKTNDSFQEFYNKNATISSVIKGLKSKINTINTKEFTDDESVIVNARALKALNSGEQASSINYIMQDKLDSEVTLAKAEAMLEKTELAQQSLSYEERARKASEDYITALRNKERLQRENAAILRSIEDKEGIYDNYFYEIDMSSGESNEVLDVITSRDFRKQYQTFHPEEVKQILAGFGVPVSVIGINESSVVGYDRLQQYVTSYTYAAAAEWYILIKSALIEENKLDIGDYKQYFKEQENEASARIIDVDDSVASAAEIERKIKTLSDDLAALNAKNYEGLSDYGLKVMGKSKFDLENLDNEAQEITRLTGLIYNAIYKARESGKIASPESNYLFDAIVDYAKKLYNENPGKSRTLQERDVDAILTSVDSHEALPDAYEGDSDLQNQKVKHEEDLVVLDKEIEKVNTNIEKINRNDYRISDQGDSKFNNFYYSIMGEYPNISDSDEDAIAYRNDIKALRSLLTGDKTEEEADSIFRNLNNNFFPWEEGDSKKKDLHRTVIVTDDKTGKPILDRSGNKTYKLSSTSDITKSELSDHYADSQVDKTDFITRKIKQLEDKFNKLNSPSLDDYNESKGKLKEFLEQQLLGLPTERQTTQSELDRVNAQIEAKQREYLASEEMTDRDIQQLEFETKRIISSAINKKEEGREKKIFKRHIADAMTSIIYLANSNIPIFDNLDSTDFSTTRSNYKTVKNKKDVKLSRDFTGLNKMEREIKQRYNRISDFENTRK